MSASTDLLTSAAQVIVKYDEVNWGRISAVDKLLKSWKIVKSLKNPKGLKKLHKLSVWKNIYKSTNPPSIRYKELELLLELWQFFELFCWAQELF